ncbi:unnamed protein product [Symbiodinium sp. CCMP2592]|nr:unnamed protein product [Symbiodinium sp. CCMP2592]
MATSSTDTRAAKLRKLNDFRRELPYISQNGLATLLQKVHKEGLPEIRQAKAMKEATRSILSSMNTYGDLLLHEPMATITGDEQNIWLTNCMSLLAGLYKQGGNWVLPGNQLGHRLERKTWAIYASFHTKLQHEDTWFLLSIARSSEVASLEAGISQVFSKLLRSIFCNKIADPRLGLCLPHATDSTQDIRLFFTMGGWIQDGLAMKQTFSTKGDSGTKFCILCNNIRSMAIHTEATLEEEEDIPGSNVTHLSECELATDQEVLTAFQTCQRLSRTMPKDQFAMYQQAAGITHNQHSMLLDQALLDQNILRPVSGYIHDWMHTMASQGVMQKSIWLLLSTTNAWDHMESFLQLWTMPAALAKAGKLHDLFTPKRTKFYRENQRFKCTASECLGLTTLLQYMVQRLWLPAGIQVDQRHSFLAMAQVQEMLQATHMSTVSPAQHQVQDALTIFKRAGNEAAMVRKHHWMLHLSTQLEAMGFLPNCWPLERKHKVVTMYATNMMKIPVFSQSLLEEVLAHDIHAVQTSDSFEESAHLVQKRHPSAQLHKYLCESVFKAAIAKDHIWTAAAAMLETGGQVHQKDYVLIQQENQWGWQIAKVECHFEAADLVCSVVRTSDLVEYDAATYSTQRLSTSFLLKRSCVQLSGLQRASE